MKTNARGQVAIVFAGTQGLLDDLPVDDLRAALTEAVREAKAQAAS